jgi:hypothetical protein
VTVGTDNDLITSMHAGPCHAALCITPLTRVGMAYRLAGKLDCWLAAMASDAVDP